MNPRQNIGVSLCVLLFAVLVAPGISAHADQTPVSKTPDATGIALVAAKAANEESLRLYESAPFTPKNGSAEFRNGHWHWHALGGYGYGDLQVDVTLTPAGEVEKIDLKMLASAPEAQSLH